MMVTESGRAPSGQALVASDEAGSRLHPSGFDPSRIAAQLRPFERAALKGEKVGGSTKPNLVKRGLMWLKPRVQAEGALPRYEYTLTETGRLVVEAIATEARRAETTGSVHEGAGRNGIAQEDVPGSDMGKGE